MTKRIIKFSMVFKRHNTLLMYQDRWSQYDANKLNPNNRSSDPYLLLFRHRYLHRTKYNHRKLFFFPFPVV